MLLTTMLVGAGLAQASTRKITLADQTFLVDSPEGSFSVKTSGKESPVDLSGEKWSLTVGGTRYTFSKGVFTATSKAGKTSTLDFTTIATTPKLFTATEISTIQAAIQSGSRSNVPSALSGWAVNNKTLFIMPRWTDAANRTWLEAVIALDPEDPATYTLVGRFKGLTTATGFASDRLEVSGGMLVGMTLADGGIGVATLNPIDSKTNFRMIGPKVTDSLFVPDSAFAVTKEPSTAGTNVLGLLDTQTWTWRRSAEIRGEIVEFMQPSIVHYRYNGRDKLLNMATGSELPLPAECGVEATGAGVLLWIPRENPAAAALYSSSTFRTLARWAKS